MAAVPDNVLELLRQQSGLSIDLEGHFCHQGERITHARTLEVLWKSLERLPDGRYLVRIGRESGYVALEDTPYVVRAVNLGLSMIGIVLSDGSSETLQHETLTLDREGILHCRVKRDHCARFSRAAQVTLGLEISEDPETPSGFCLLLGNRAYPIMRE